jgi:hypothetical protein
MTAPVRRNAIYIGTDISSKKKLYVNLKWLQEKHWHVIGPPGQGKTRLLLHLFQCLCRLPRSTVVLFNCKGALGRMARDSALATGHTARLTWFDPTSGIGYNPLHPNHLQIHAHAKVVRESIRAAWGQNDFDATPRLAKYLYLSLCLARTFGWGLHEALQILRPRAPLRRSILPRLTDPFLREALLALDSMDRRLQDEHVESCISRLEPFVCDPAIAPMLTARRSLDTHEVITRHKILIVNLEIRRPLAVDDVRLIGRMVLNDIASQVFANSGEQTYFIIDEAHEFLTADFCQLLNMGREVGAHVIAAHQHLDQLRQADGSQEIYGAVMKSARVKAVFGDVESQDLDVLLRDAMIDQYDYKKVKDEIDALELEPIESTRDTVTRGLNIGGSFVVNSGTSSANARGKSYGNSRQWGASRSHTDGLSVVHSNATNSGVSTGETLLPNGETIQVEHNIEGNTEADASGITTTDTYGEFQSQGEQDSTSETQIEGTQGSKSFGLNGGLSFSKSTAPFYEYKKTRRVSSRTFETEQEFLTRCIQKMKALPVGQFMLKLPQKPALFVQAPYVPDPWITERRKQANLTRVFAQPCYETAGIEPGRNLIDVPTPAPTPATYQSAPPALEFAGDPPSDFLEDK